MSLLSHGQKPSRYRFQVRVDTRRRLIIVRVMGNMKSTYVVDRLFNLAKRLEKPWAWRRLVDLRVFGGFIEYEDIEHLARRWQFLTRDVADKGRTAIVSHSALDLARVSTIVPLFPGEVLQGFESVDEALEWLSSGSAV